MQMPHECHLAQGNLSRAGPQGENETLHDDCREQLRLKQLKQQEQNKHNGTKTDSNCSKETPLDGKSSIPPLPLGP